MEDPKLYLEEFKVEDEWTKKLENLLLDIAKIAEKENKRYYFGGGFSIDLSLGQLTRSHEDIDFHPKDKDTEWWKNWFVQKGFTVTRDSEDMQDLPNTFLVENEKRDYFADVYPVRFEPDGRVTLFKTDVTYARWEGKLWNRNKKVEYKGVNVYIEDPVLVIEQKLDHARRHKIPLSEKHLHDLSLFEKYLKVE